MKNRKYQIEKIKGKVPFNWVTLFLDRTTDMQSVEYWEDRLEEMEQHYAVVYEQIGETVYYSIFVNARKGRKAFK